jgi:hypothetical protein
VAGGSDPGALSDGALRSGGTQRVDPWGCVKALARRQSGSGGKASLEFFCNALPHWLRRLISPGEADPAPDAAVALNR